MNYVEIKEKGKKNTWTGCPCVDKASDIGEFIKKNLWALVKFNFCIKHFINKLQQK